jgi:hypothetical protein
MRRWLRLKLAGLAWRLIPNEVRAELSSPDPVCLAVFVGESEDGEVVPLPWPFFDELWEGLPLN